MQHRHLLVLFTISIFGSCSAGDNQLEPNAATPNGEKTLTLMTPDIEIACPRSRGALYVNKTIAPLSSFNDKDTLADNRVNLINMGFSCVYFYVNNREWCKAKLDLHPTIRSVAFDGNNKNGFGVLARLVSKKDDKRQIQLSIWDAAHKKLHRIIDRETTFDNVSCILHADKNRFMYNLLDYGQREKPQTALHVVDFTKNDTEEKGFEAHEVTSATFDMHLHDLAHMSGSLSCDTYFGTSDQGLVQLFLAKGLTDEYKLYNWKLDVEFHDENGETITPAPTKLGHIAVDRSSKKHSAFAISGLLNQKERLWGIFTITTDKHGFSLKPLVAKLCKKLQKKDRFDRLYYDNGILAIGNFINETILVTWPAQPTPAPTKTNQQTTARTDYVNTSSSSTSSTSSSSTDSQNI